MRTKNAILVLLFAALMQSCEYFDFDFGSQGEEDVIARVNDAYLYKADIESLVNASMSKEDSTIIVNNYIDRWATQQLLTDRAKLNINLERQQKFDKMVEDYRNQLYTKAYSDAMVIKALDSIVDDNEVEQYYEENKETFTLNETLYQLRYIRVNDAREAYRLKREFVRFDEKDRDTLSSSIAEYTVHNLNDSIWKSYKSWVAEIPVLEKAETWQLKNTQNYVQLKDSLGVYMMYIQDRRERGSQAPMQYVRATVEQIILNKRKQDLIKQLRTDITKDAIKNNEFEIYK